MAAKIKVASFLNFYSKSMVVIINIHIDNLVLQPKSDTDNYCST